MCLWDENIKMDIKENSFVLGLLTTTGDKAGYFGKGSEVILLKKLNNFKYFTIESF